MGVWPEGFKGVGKPFSERYKLQRFGRGGFVSAALRARVPIIPTAIVGAEETYPMLGDIAPLARLLGIAVARRRVRRGRFRRRQVAVVARRRRRRGRLAW